MRDFSSPKVKFDFLVHDFLLVLALYPFDSVLLGLPYHFLFSIVLHPSASVIFEAYPVRWMLIYNFFPLTVNFPF